MCCLNGATYSLFQWYALVDCKSAHSWWLVYPSLSLTHGLLRASVTEWHGNRYRDYTTGSEDTTGYGNVTTPGWCGSGIGWSKSYKLEPTGANYISSRLGYKEIRTYESKAKVLGAVGKLDPVHAVPDVYERCLQRRLGQDAAESLYYVMLHRSILCTIL